MPTFLVNIGKNVEHYCYATYIHVFI